MSERIRLRAEDTLDLAIISALLQDARTSLSEMVYDAEERRFMVACTRYRREKPHDVETCEGLTECPAVLVFDCIEEVKHRGLDAEDPGLELSLLTIATEPGQRLMFHIDLVFDEDREIQLRSDCIDCRIDDFGEPVVARRTPCDHFADLLKATPESDPAASGG
ncbi:MAG: DUF2948 family protein [Geminicoccaceae bacterium]|nr:DUF2948 family protein [Geminicoccaceae bacterium]